ncbi:MAG: patatin-like phospholipase family protein [Actinomycetota bacterium]
MSRYSILSLDGGGSWAIIQVRALMAIYGDVTGHEVLKNFRLVIANSGGSITAGALFSNIRLSQAFRLFYSEEWRRRMFVDRAWPIAAINRKLGFFSRYLTEEKLEGLKRAFGPMGAGAMGGIALHDTPMDELPKRAADGSRLPHLVITAFDYHRERAKFFRSNTGSLAGNRSAGPVPKLPWAIHASSTAPVNYFDCPAVVDSELYWDGGVAGLNNPVMAGVVEALADPEREGAAVVALSIGTGSARLPLEPPADPVHHERKGPGPINDVRKLATSILDDPPDAASFMAHVVLGGTLPTDDRPSITDGPVVRLNPLIQPIWTGTGWQMPPPDYADDFDTLKELDMDAVKQEQVEAIDRLCDWWLCPAGVVPNQPLRAERDTLVPQIGHRWAADAIAQWRAMVP